MAFTNGGYDAVLSLGAGPTDISAMVKVVNLRKTWASLNRTTFTAAGAQGRGAGVYGVGFTCNGVIDTTLIDTLEGLLDGTAIAFTLEVTDGGTAWAGSAVPTNFEMAADADGDWTFTLSMESTGAVTYS